MRPWERHSPKHVKCFYPLVKQPLVHTFTETIIKLPLLEFMGRNVILSLHILDKLSRFDKKNVFSITIPGENMTEYKRESTWRSEYIFNASYRSSDVIINI